MARPIEQVVVGARSAATCDYGRIDSLVRTPAQTDIAFFWSENPYVHWNRNGEVPRDDVAAMCAFVTLPLAAPEGLPIRVSGAPMRGRWPWSTP